MAFGGVLSGHLLTLPCLILSIMAIHLRSKDSKVVSSHTGGQRGDGQARHIPFK